MDGEEREIGGKGGGGARARSATHWGLPAPLYVAALGVRACVCAKTGVAVEFTPPPSFSLFPLFFPSFLLYSPVAAAPEIAAAPKVPAPADVAAG